MADLNLRGIDDKLMLQLKTGAAGQKMTLKDYCIMGLGALAEADAPGEKTEAVARSKREAIAREPEHKATIGRVPASGPAYEQPSHAENCRCLMCKPPKSGA